MGGVAGHLKHLYDDRGVTFNKIKKILTGASRGELEGTEKTDGYNIYLGVKNEAGAWAPAWARNKGDMQANGKTFADLAAREFQGGESVKKVYLDAFKSYEVAIKSLNSAERAKIFGPKGDIFYNTEIQGPGASNVVNYDTNILSIHRSGHKRYNSEENTLENADLSEYSDYLDNVVDKFEQATANQEFSVRRTAILKLNELDGDYDLNIALQKMQKAGFSGNMTIEEFLEDYLRGEVERKLNFLNPDTQQAVIDRILKKEGWTPLTHIYKGFPMDVKQRIKLFVDESPEMFKDAIWPIETAIHDFSVELLKGLKSAYILDNDAELSRLKGEVEGAIKAIQSYQGEDVAAAHKVLVQQLEKLKHHDNITTVVEGFVFQVDDQMYKFTGNFAPINQLLGLFRYGRGKTPPLEKTEKVVGEQPMIDIEESDQTYALIPGKFKPPHRGHLDMIKHYSTLADKVIILVSPVERKYGDEGKKITAADSIRIWELYLNAARLDNVDIEIAEFNSPVQAAIEYGNKVEMHGKNILLGASTKGGDAAQRFGANVQKYVPNAKILDPLKYAFCCVGVELNATDFRAALASPEKDIEKFLPDEARDKSYEIFDILGLDEVRKLREEKSPPLGIFLGLIEQTINEFSSVSPGGNVEGGPTKGVWTGLNVKKANDEEKKRSKENKKELKEDEKNIPAGKITFIAGRSPTGFRIARDKRDRRRGGYPLKAMLDYWIGHGLSEDMAQYYRDAFELLEKEDIPEHLWLDVEYEPSTQKLKYHSRGLPYIREEVDPYSPTEYAKTPADDEKEGLVEEIYNYLFKMRTNNAN
jgi:cytidyltransferase-like protein